MVYNYMLVRYLVIINQVNAIAEYTVINEALMKNMTSVQTYTEKET